MKKLKSTGQLLVSLIVYVVLSFFLTISTGNCQYSFPYPATTYSSYPSTSYSPLTSSYADPFAQLYGASPYTTSPYTTSPYTVPTYTTPTYSTPTYGFPSTYGIPTTSSNPGYVVVIATTGSSSYDPLSSALNSVYPYLSRVAYQYNPTTTPYNPYSPYTTTPYTTTPYTTTPYTTTPYSTYLPYTTTPYTTTPYSTYPPYTTTPYSTYTPSYTTPTTTTISGTWTGSWTSNGSQGGALLTLTQSGTNLTGSISFTTQTNQAKLSTTITGIINGATIQLWATINGGTDVYNLSVVGNINGTVLNGNYRITNNSSVELESGTINLGKQY